MFYPLARGQQREQWLFLNTFFIFYLILLDCLMTFSSKKKEKEKRKLQIKYIRYKQMGGNHILASFFLGKYLQQSNLFWGKHFSCIKHE